MGLALTEFAAPRCWGPEQSRDLRESGALGNTKQDRFR